MISSNRKAREYGKSLAPVYDVMCTAVYPNLSRVNAMSIGGARGFGDVTRQSFAAMAEEAGMRPPLVLHHLDAMVKAIPQAARVVAEELEANWPSGVYAKIEAVIRDQISRVA